MIRQIPTALVRPGISAAIGRDHGQAQAPNRMRERRQRAAERSRLSPMKQSAALFLRREVVFLVLAILLCVGAAVAYWASRATVLTVAVAPRDGTEPALIHAYADALAKRHKEIRLRILPFDDVRDSAEALRDGRADLAVVRPDVDLPDNGLTLAVLRDQAMIIAAPEASGIDRFPDPGPPGCG
jgi:hypothetical protein